MSNPELSQNQYLAIAVLVSGCSIPKAAKKANVSERTVDNWLKQDLFKTELRKATDAVYKAHLVALNSLLGDAIARLKDILSNPDSKDSDLIAVTKLLLSAVERYTSNDLEERLSILEEKLNDQT